MNCNYCDKLYDCDNNYDKKYVENCEQRKNEIIFFDWHHGDKNICGDTSFGQITLADWEGNKIDVVNIDCILESEFIKIFEILRLSENIKVEYNYL